MDPLIFQYIREFFRQLRLHAFKVVIALAVISFVIMSAGVLHNPKFETSITIYADDQNVIKPLLEGQAAVTVPKNERIRVVREIMFAPRILTEVIAEAWPDEPALAEGGDKLEALMRKLRQEIEISAPADRYITVAYSHEKPSVSYKVVNKLTNLFIEESAENKRKESKSAYSFIDEQVKSYKNQLVEAENRLKAFEAANTDGVESQVAASINRLQATIDDTAIDIESLQVKIAALEEQLKTESRYASSDYSARVYRERLANLETRMDSLRLNLRDEHPDVVDLRFQIQDLKRTIVEVENADSSERAGLTGENLNPIYEELSNQLAESKVELQTMKHRLAANRNRLEQQYERRSRVASNQAELSELTRDYDVTKNIYEDLLERKERARISMTLDLAGQGVSYKILEPAVFPSTPTGIRFIHYASLGPIVGLVLPLGLLLSIVLFDHRVRFPEQLEDEFPGVVLAILPPEKAMDTNWKTLLGVFAGFVVVYSGAAVAISVV